MPYRYNAVTAAEYREFIAHLNNRDTNKRLTRPHRLPSDRYTYSDNEFFITICARHLNNLFLNHELATAIINALLRQRELEHLRIFCYCLMPDHLHFILQLLEETRPLRNGGIRGVAPTNVLDIVGDFKSYTTSQIWWKNGGRGKLWQRSSHDRVIRHNDSVEESVGYVLMNPSRKNLVENWEDYPYSAIIDEYQ